MERGGVAFAAKLALTIQQLAKPPRASLKDLGKKLFAFSRMEVAAGELLGCSVNTND